MRQNGLLSGNPSGTREAVARRKLKALTILNRTDTPIHSAPAHSSQKAPGVPTLGQKPKPLGYIEGREDHHLRSGCGPETADREDRAAWPYQQRRSTYTHKLKIPNHVVPWDTTTAAIIARRIDKVMEEGSASQGGGGWTKNEYNRLNAMLKAWEKRAAGEDPVFNMKGWDKQGKGHNLPPTLKAIKQIKEALDDSQMADGSPFKTKVKRGRQNVDLSSQYR